VIPADLVPAGCTWPIVLGIDPGTRALGYGALVLAPAGPRLVACGVIAPRARAPVPARLAEIQVGLERLLTALRPCVLALERAFHSKNVQAAFRIGEARGVVLAAAARAEVEILELAPAAAKKAVLGHGGASKEQVARMIARWLGTGPLDVPADATDALALAFACLKRASVRAVLRREDSHSLAAAARAPSNGRHGRAREEGRRSGTGAGTGARAR
jgi:crossover junction endodeoxyribonuclease RuvC